jgi:periplasmic divalent cation tolerance protein
MTVDRGIVVVLVTGPDRETLVEIGRRVVEDRLAACANVLDGVSSVYRWKENVEEAGEALAILKTTRDRTAPLEDLVRAQHPYEEPEFIVLPVLGGSDSYIEWVARSVAESPED